MDKNKSELLRAAKGNILLKAQQEYSKRWLEITGLKVGDETIGSFYYSHGSSKQSYGGMSKETPCVVKQDENGVVYLETIDTLPQSRTVYERNRPWIVYDHVKKINRICDLSNS